MFRKLRRCCCRQAWQGTANSIRSTLIFNRSKKFASIENNILCGNCVNLFFSFAHCVAHRCATRSSRKDEADKNNPWKRIKSWTERYFPSFSFFLCFCTILSFLCVCLLSLAFYSQLSHWTIYRYPSLKFGRASQLLILLFVMGFEWTFSLFTSTLLSSTNKSNSMSTPYDQTIW